LEKVLIVVPTVILSKLLPAEFMTILSNIWHIF